MGTVTKRLTYLQPAVEKLRAALGENLIAVVLYGSHARGEVREDSDVDLLVITRGLPERRYDRSVYLQSLIQGIGGVPELSVVSL